MKSRPLREEELYICVQHVFMWGMGGGAPSRVCPLISLQARGISPRCAAQWVNGTAK